MGGMLSSIISQLVTKTTTSPVDFLRFYDKHKKENTRPSLNKLTQLFVSLCKTYFRKVYLLLDALDECKERAVLLPTLRDMMASAATSLMITSRAEQDIIEGFAATSITKVFLDTGAVSEDVRLFVTRQIEVEPYLCHLGQQLKDEITTSLGQGAKGM
jgi:hypothetical protein